MATIFALLAVAVVLFCFLLIMLLQGISESYVSRDTQTQQKYCRQLADTMELMVADGNNTDSLITYLKENVEASSGSYPFLIENGIVVFAKNDATTNSLKDLTDASLFMKELIEQEQILTTEGVGETYVVGIISDKDYFLSEDSIETYELYIILLFAAILLLAVISSSALTGEWTKSESKVKRLEETLLQRNKDFEKLQSMDHFMVNTTSLISHYDGEANRYQQYKFKFYLNARHAIYLDGNLGQMHPHTWEITLHVIKIKEDFIPFTELEKEIEGFISTYQDKELNSLEPFDALNPTLENCCNFFRNQLTRILEDKGWLLLLIEMSETPSRSYVVSLISDDT